MTQARISFLVPSQSDFVSEALRADGWSLDSDGAMVPGTSVTASYGGAYPRTAVDRMTDRLDRAGADYVAVVAGGVDPAMDTPAPAWLDVGARWQVEGRELRLPRGFRVPVVDVRTLVAAGMPEDEAIACVSLVTGRVPASAGAVAALAA